MMRKQIVAGFVVALMISMASLAVSRANESSGDKGVVEKAGEAAKKIGKKIEEGFKKTAKKIEDKHVPEKVEKKLKKAADKTAEGFEKAERKIKQKLAD
jgi:hypothetical protein